MLRAEEEPDVFEGDEELLSCDITDDRSGKEIPFTKVKEAFTLAYTSKLAYSQYTTVKKDLQQCNIPGIADLQLKAIHKINSRSNVHGFIALDNMSQVVIVSIRGSRSIGDWISNFNTRKYKVNGVKFHEGFYKDLDSAYYSITHQLIPYINSGMTIYITGHSRGGALATILAYRIVQDYPAHCKQFKMFSFGSPPVGDKAFVKRFKRFGIESFAVTAIGDNVSYIGCPIPLYLMSWKSYHKPYKIVYLPHKGDHSITDTYIAQLKSIQTQDDYNKEYEEQPLEEYDEAIDDYLTQY